MRALIKSLTLAVVFLFLTTISWAQQSANGYFHASAKQYIDGNNHAAKSLLADGLRQYPGDPKLTALDGKIKEEDKKDEEEEKKKNKEEEEKKNEENQQKQNEEEKKEQENQENSQDQEQQEQEQEEQKEGEEGKEEEQEKQQQEKDDKSEDNEKEKSEQSEDNEQEDKGDKENKPMGEESDKMTDMKISEEKAKMILEALKNNEVQYIQQNRRKAKKKKDQGKPDW